MKKIILFAVLSIALCGIACADFGKSGWTIFTEPQPAKFNLLSLVSLGNPSLVSVFYNPSVAVMKSQSEVSFFSEIGFADSRMSGVVYAEPLTGGVLTGGFAYYDAGKMDLNWIENGSVQSSNVTAQRDIMGSASYSFKFEENIFVGASLKAATSEIAGAGSATAIALDFGTFYVPEEDITISCALQNIGFASKFEYNSDPLPSSLFAGIGYHYKYREYGVMPALGFTGNFADSKTVFDIGSEFSYDNISLDLGYRANGGESDVHIGANIDLDDLSIGYAFLPGNYLEPTHRINVSYRFGSVHNYDTYDLLLQRKGLSFD